MKDGREARVKIDRGKIRLMSTMSKGWDGDEGPAVASSSIDDLERFVSLATSRGVVEPRFSLSTDTEIALFWRTGDGFASIEFLPSGGIVAFARKPGEFEPFRATGTALEAIDMDAMLAALAVFRDELPAGWDGASRVDRTPDLLDVNEALSR